MALFSKAVPWSHLIKGVKKEIMNVCKKAIILHRLISCPLEPFDGRREKEIMNVCEKAFILHRLMSIL